NSLSEYADSRERVKHFSFDFCYDSTLTPQRPEYASQQLVFQDLGTEVLQAAFEGYNACVFAYGQTSTGKTYTMMGNTEDVGLIPRICEGLFSHVDDFMGEKVTFRLDVSYFEIYNERVRDLLRPGLTRGNENYTLKVREHPKEGPYVQDLSSHCVKDNQGIQELIDRGNENRTTASTYMHDHSSRSHAIFTINFTQAKFEDDLPHEIVSKIHLVDLAGSERADPNYNANYKGRLKEGSNINKSLVTLGNVIKALAERSLLSWSNDNLGSTQSFQSTSALGESGRSLTPSPKRTRLPYIPYRDSVLTWLLKDSLGGNSKTIMIATITPASLYYNETISTLRYAQRAKSIINKPKINEDPNVSLIRELRREIGYLRELLKTAHMANKLTQTWMDKWLETHDIMKESDLSIRGLKHKANSMGIMIESQMPHLIGMDDDILSTGVTIYHLKEGKTLVGREDAQRQQDIVLSGPSVQREHCFIKNHYGTVTIHPNRGAQITINGLECKVPTRLKQGDYLVLGKTNMFRFNNPAEAAKLRQRRESYRGSEEMLSITSSTDSLDTDDMDQYSQRGIHPFHPIYGPKKELEALRDQHSKAEEAIKEKEEEIWRVHEEHRAEIEEEKRKVARMMEEVQKQREQAETELSYAQECLQKEKEAFYNELQEKMSSIKQKDQDNMSSQSPSESGIPLLPSYNPSSETPDKPIQEIVETCKQSKQGCIKDLVQGELIKTLHHRETEESLRRQSEDLEDYFEQSKEEIRKQLGKIQEIEQEYKTEDAEHYREIHDKETMVEEIQKREEQLQLYIEEKEDLVLVSSHSPKPLRAACSEEVLTLTGSQVKDVGFPVRTVSLRGLNRGSEGDLPSMSHRLSTLHCNQSADSILNDSMESMDFSTTSGVDEEDNKRQNSKVSATAKSVTDRLYKAPTPKFKYEPKTRSSKPESASKTKYERRPGRSEKDPHKTDGQDDSVKKRGLGVGRGASPRSSPARASPARVSPARTSTRSSPARASPARSSPARSSPARTSPVRTVSPAAKVPKTSSSATKQKPISGKDKHSDSKLKDNDGKSLHKSKSSPQISIQSASSKRLSPRSVSPSSPVSPERNLLSPDFSSTSSSSRSRRLSPTSSLSPEQGGNGNGRLFVPRLRHVTSATSLVSVPEAILEEAEPIEQPLIQSVPNIPQVVIKRRKKRQNDEDEFRRHSEPMGEELADAFEKYTQEIEDSIERERIEKKFIEKMEKDSLPPNDDNNCVLKDNQNIPDDLDTCEMRQVKSESDLFDDRSYAPFMDSSDLHTISTEGNDLNRGGCEEESLTIGMECRLDLPVNMVTDDNLMVCSVSSAASDTLSVESNISDASTVIDSENVFQEPTENLEDENIRLSSEEYRGVRAGSKRESSGTVIIDDTVVPKKCVKTEQLNVCPSKQSSSDKGSVNDKIGEERQANSENGDFVKHDDAYSSDSLDEADKSVDSLEKPSSPKDDVIDGDGFSDSLDESDSDVKSSTLTSLTGGRTMSDSYSTDLQSSLEHSKGMKLPSSTEVSSADAVYKPGLPSSRASDADITNRQELMTSYKEKESERVVEKHVSDGALNTEGCQNLANESKSESKDSKGKFADQLKSKSEATKNKKSKSKRYKPSTRTLGVSTSPDLMPPELLENPDDDVASQASHDSLQEVKEQLMELEEALQKESQENQRGSFSNGTQISTARKATRHRAMIRQKQRGGSGESDAADQISDGPSAAANQQKTSSRPGSASRRRRRAQLKPTDRKSKRLRGLSSEEYNSTDSDGIHSNITLSDEEKVSGEGIDVVETVLDESANSDSNKDVTKFARKVNDGCTSDDKDADDIDSDLDQYCAELQRLEELEQSDTEENCSASDSRSEREKMNGVKRRNRYMLPEEEEDFLPEKSAKQKFETFSVDSQYESQEERSSSRTPSETRDIGQQTDVSSVDSPLLSPFSPFSSLRSPSSTSTQTESRRSRSRLSISPVSVWNSVEKEIISPRKCSSSHGLSTHPERKIPNRRSRLRSANLRVTQTDVWSVESCIDSVTENGISNNQNVSDSSESEDDGSYTMEAESISPQTPSSSERFVENGRFTFEDTQRLRATPVRYEVTIKEEETNVLYNVDKTEYRTYGLASPVNYENMTLPESININLSNTTTHTTENSRNIRTSDHRNYQRSDVESSSRDSAIISERNFRCVRDMSVSDSGTDRESSVDRQVVDDQQACGVEIRENLEPSKLDFLHSPRESDTTSDYGTMIGEGRRCNTSFLSDSGSEADVQTQAAENVDLETSDILNPPHYFRVGEHNFSRPDEEGLDSISPAGQDLCTSDRVRRKRPIAPCASSLSRTPVHVSNTVTNPDHDNDNSPLEKLVNLIEGDSNRQNESLTNDVDDPDGNLSSNEDNEFDTPEASPRVERCDGGDRENVRQTSELIKSATDSVLLEIKQPNLKTVSVNTEERSTLLSKPHTTQDDNSLREVMKRELQQKIDRLQRNVRSRSDSAISSDYTEGDSTSVSPRGSRLYDSDKTLRFGASGNIFGDITPNTNIEVMTTQTNTPYDQGRVLQSPSKSLDIDNKIARKSPFKDSGNVCDDDIAGLEIDSNVDGENNLEFDQMNENTIDLMSPTDFQSRYEESATDDASERSLSPGEVMLEYVFPDKFKASREHPMNENLEQCDDESELRIVKEKSPSLSNLCDENEKEDFRRSMSENCLDQYEEKSDVDDNNCSSNDSIVFVFMGNSHSKDSMEQLKSFTSRQPGYKVELESSQELLENEELIDLSESAQKLKNDDVNQAKSGSKHEISEEDKINVNIFDDEDDRPLRHRFGIDESVLPIPTKSVSCDNLPKQSLADKNIHRSRSASLLDVGLPENVNDPKNNEGIFPPCVEASERGSNSTSLIEHGVSSVNSSNLAESTSSSMGEDTVVPNETSEEITYSKIPLGISPTEQTFVSEERIAPESHSREHAGRYRAPVLIERGMVTSHEELASLSTNHVGEEVGTQTNLEGNFEKSSKTGSHHTGVLPSLDSPFRARSIGDVSQPARDTELSLSEETDNWYNLSSMVNETNAIIRNIQDEPIHGNTSYDKMPRKVGIEKTSFRDVSNEVTQTGPSCFKFNTSSDGTQTESARLEIAEVETTDILPFESEAHVNVNEDMRHERSESKNMEQPISSETKTETEESEYKTEYHKEHQESRKHESANETVIVEREYVYETDFEYPDLEVSNAEMDALKREHEKMMETIRKASDNRKTRTEKMREKIRNHEGNMVYTVDSKDRYRSCETDDNPVDTQLDDKNRKITTSSENSEVLSDETIHRTSYIDENMSSNEERCKTHYQTWGEGTAEERPLDSTNSKSTTQGNVIHDETSEESTHKRYEYIFIDTIIQSDSDEEKSENNTEENTLIPNEGVLDASLAAPFTHDRLDETASKEDHTDSLQTVQDANEVDEAVKPDTCTEESPKESVSNTPVKLDKTDGMESHRHEISEVVLSEQRMIKDQTQAYPVSNWLRSAPKERSQIEDEMSPELRQYVQNSVASQNYDVIDDVLSETESLKTPPNSPTPVAFEQEVVEKQIQKESKPMERTDLPLRLSGLVLKDKSTKRGDVFRRSVSESAYRPNIQNRNIRQQEEERDFRPCVHETVSTGVEAAVDISDDFTQTDLLLDFSRLENPHTNLANPQHVENHKIKEELDRLQKERVHILELLSLNYLPASLTVELLEAKLNYCIGQTDLLLNSLEDNWDDYEITISENTHVHHSYVTKEYLSKYRSDLQQSKSDIEICKDKMERNMGTGRGRPKWRNRDVLRLKRQAEVEAFKAERSREQHTYNRIKTHDYFKHQDARSSRSTSPTSPSSPRHATPTQHKNHLLQIRKHVVNRTLSEQHQHDRVSRSCSPQMVREYRRLTTSTRPHTSLSGYRLLPANTSYEPHLSYSPRIAFTATDELPPDFDYGFSTYVVPPRHFPSRGYSSESRPRSTTLLSPTQLSDHGDSSPRGRSLSPRLIQQKYEQTRPIYAHEESRDLLREMEETREQNQREISKAKHTLQSYRNHRDRNTASRGHESTPNLHTRSYSSYSDYAKDILDSSYQSINGVMSGSYELYDDEISRLTSQYSLRSYSPTSSVKSADLDSFPDPVYSGTFNPFRTRPVRSTDIKSRLQWMRYRSKKT
ncbi:hypothetical protein FSP39_024188, partial [Pinctada imbricata]